MSKDRKIDIEEVNGVTVVRLLEKKILDESNIEALGQELLACARLPLNCLYICPR